MDEELLVSEDKVSTTCMKLAILSKVFNIVIICHHFTQYPCHYRRLIFINIIALHNDDHKETDKICQGRRHWESVMMKNDEELEGLDTQVKNSKKMGEHFFWRSALQCSEFFRTLLSFQLHQNSRQQLYFDLHQNANQLPSYLLIIIKIPADCQVIF